jgi:CheY-like chemotaxis protein
MSEENLNGMTAMIIDDQRTMRSIMFNMLKQIGVDDVHEASEGQEALDKLNYMKDKPDFILCDLHMDGMDGLEFCQKLRLSKFDALREIKILVLTGDPDRFMREISEQIGAVAVLQKPISAPDLKKEVMKALGLIIA